MDRTRSGLRKVYSWVRAVVALALMGVFGWTMYQNYIADNEPDSTIATTTSAVAIADDGNGAELEVMVSGPLPHERITVRVASSSPSNPTQSLTDGDPATTWACSPCVSDESPGIGETITFELGGEVGLESIQLLNGFPDGSGFLANNRIQRLQIDLGSGPLETTLPDTPQLVTIKVAGTATQVTLSVLSIYQSGTGGGGFGISEVTFFGSYSP